MTERLDVTKRYELIPNEFKLFTVLFITLWMTASLFFIAVGYPFQMVRTLSEKITNTLLCDFIILSINICCTVPPISYVLLPAMIKLLQHWIFDDVQILESEPDYQRTVSVSVDSLAGSKDKRNMSADKFSASFLSLSNCFASMYRAATRGIIRVPAFVQNDNANYQSVPVKWKFTLLITCTIISVEFLLFQLLYKNVFHYFELTNIVDTETSENALDVRVRNAIFLWVDFCISVPILFYLINPLIVNRLCPRFMYRKQARNKSNVWHSMLSVLKSGFESLESINQGHIIDRIIQKMQTAGE